MRGLLAICACAAILGGCVFDSDDAPSTHEKYVSLLKGYGSSTLTLYIEDTTFHHSENDSARIHHEVISMCPGTGIFKRYYVVGIDSMAKLLEHYCGSEIGKTYVNSINPSITKTCYYDKPSDFVVGYRTVRIP